MAPIGPGVLVVHVAPWAQVTIDGRAFGSTPVRATLSAGRHRVVLDNPDAGKHESLTVTIGPGHDTALDRSW